MITYGVQKWRTIGITIIFLFKTHSLIIVYSNFFENFFFNQHIHDGTFDFAKELAGLDCFFRRDNVTVVVKYVTIKLFGLTSVFFWCTTSFWITLCLKKNNCKTLKCTLIWTLYFNKIYLLCYVCKKFLKSWMSELITNNSSCGFLCTIFACNKNCLTCCH